MVRFASHRLSHMCRAQMGMIESPSSAVRLRQRSRPPTETLREGQTKILCFFLLICLLIPSAGCRSTANQRHQALANSPDAPPLIRLSETEALKIAHELAVDTYNVNLTNFEAPVATYDADRERWMIFFGGRFPPLWFAVFVDAWTKKRTL